tara:strand:+ start:392085 stop:392489 length:405 start_codon:yes stop_codon:yes gene_type:complete
MEGKTVKIAFSFLNFTKRFIMNSKFMKKIVSKKTFALGAAAVVAMAAVPAMAEHHEGGAAPCAAEHGHMCAGHEDAAHPCVAEHPCEAMHPCGAEHPCEAMHDEAHPCGAEHPCEAHEHDANPCEAEHPCEAKH